MYDCCANCDVKRLQEHCDPDSELYFAYYSELDFTCYDCPCNGCEHIHTCDGQCYSEME